ncbi:MAG TPA: sigma 54-interacting transcriptional regulator [Polyangiaceae bacterium]|nr:sigma 54-interacting transcriptional regulator [Polyangiaceae bacterium]
MSRLGEQVLTLVLCWSQSGEHLGEGIRVLADGPRSGWWTFGSGSCEGEGETLQLTRQRPGRIEARPFENPVLARAELGLCAEPHGIDVRALGKRRLIADDGRRVERVLVRPGETLEVEDQLLFICSSRPTDLPGSAPDPALHPFGLADQFGIVGESPAAWKLRESIAFMAARTGHLLLIGQTGTGKELVAQAIHALSNRSHRPLVARNAAVFPPGLVDAELFGNVLNYPNVGSPERPGLIGQAQGSVLFLDEIGELPHDLQAHLLRVLDSGGEYQRLGEVRARTADVRIIGATARSPEQLRLDFGARFRLRLDVPGLDERREDIALVARHLLTQGAKSDPLAERLFQAKGQSFGVTPALMRFLVTHRYRAHVRELDALLWRAIASNNGCLDLPGVMASAARTNGTDLAPRPQASRRPPTRTEIRACLERHGGVQERVWRDLGLSSRYALKRLIQKYALRSSDAADDSDT